ncbi:alpha/beta fold hydrolase [Marivita hallyeonensis]|uniref:Haloacetate dehalogenase n=1 Tax=Marivita hallyeonensis TaxID=996342 RepID=A0A1M5WG28_9RHOB|nr:alpha/beta hydrolase [Marivita hallyeonensis]SHH86509.1 haloacetate dehalogenase [Marivita hallyeonensis]
MFDTFDPFDIETSGARISGVNGGEGPPLLLLHGYPQTHVMWHKVAPGLSRHFTVVAADLRGYGASSKPATDARHTPYSKRAMAQDMAEVMTALGHDTFFLCGHDRGGRVAHRLAADHSNRVRKIAVLDIAPTREMYRNTTEAFARAYWHWFWLILPNPLPEQMINADPEAFLTYKCGHGSAGLSPFTEDAWSAYLSAIRSPATVHAMCEDYRAAASIDLEHDDADAQKLPMPLLALWGKRGTIEACFDCLDLWRQRAEDVRGWAMDGGHYLAEERPDDVQNALIEFFLEGPAP